jgi:hypothetical protein
MRFGLIARALQPHGAVTFCASALSIVLDYDTRKDAFRSSARCSVRAARGNRSICLGSVLFLIGFFAYMSLQSRRRARELAVAAAREKQRAEEIREAERARQEAIAEAEWNARFV